MSRDTVLVVRETPSLADSVEELLLSEGYHVRRAANGREALRLISRTHRPPVQAVLVVCNEPVCSNMESIAALGLSMPVLVLGWRGPTFEESPHDQVTFLRLPISAGQLLEEVRHAVSHPTLTDPPPHAGHPPGALGPPLAHTI